jgi:hypothetical protein
VKRRLLPVLALLAALAPLRAHGCAACFGKSDSPMALGMNYGIMALLAVIVTVLTFVASFFVFVVRREARLAEVEAAGPAEPPQSL